MNSTNATEVLTNIRTNEHTNERTDKWKTKTIYRLGINAGGIIMKKKTIEPWVSGNHSVGGGGGGGGGEEFKQKYSVHMPIQSKTSPIKWHFTNLS